MFARSREVHGASIKVRSVFVVAAAPREHLPDLGKNGWPDG